MRGHVPGFMHTLIFDTILIVRDLLDAQSTPSFFSHAYLHGLVSVICEFEALLFQDLHAKAYLNSCVVRCGLDVDIDFCIWTLLNWGDCLFI